MKFVISSGNQKLKGSITMRRTIACIVIFSLISILFAQKNKPSTKDAVSGDFIIKEKIEQEWNDGTWTNYKKSFFKYTAKDRLVEKTEELWIRKVWALSYKYTYTYDKEGRLIEELMQDWLQRKWVNNTRHTFAYDSQGDVKEELVQLWEGDKWINQYKTTYTPKK